MRTIPGEGKTLSVTLDEITYHLRVPSVADRVAFRRAMGEQQARLHSPLDLLRLLRRGAAEIMANSPAESREFILGAIDQQIARAEALDAAGGVEGFDLTSEEGRTAFGATMLDLAKGAEALAEIEKLVSRSYAPYASALGDNAVFWTLSGIEVARIFMVGSDGIEGFSRSALGASEAFLSSMPEAHFTGLAVKAIELLAPAQAKPHDKPKKAARPTKATATAEAAPASS